MSHGNTIRKMSNYWVFNLKGVMVIGVIILFLSVAVQPVIIADDSIIFNNSELVEITVEIYEVDKTYNHTVMLTQEQAEELELLINNTKSVLDTADNLDETEAIFKDILFSLSFFFLSFPSSAPFSPLFSSILGNRWGILEMVTTVFPFPHSGTSSSFRSLPFLGRPKKSWIFSEVPGIKGQTKTETILRDSRR